MSKVAKNGRKTYNNQILCKDIMCSFCAINRYIMVPTSGKHCHIYLLGESVDRAGMVMKHVKQLTRKHLDMVHDPNRIWNLDEMVGSAIKITQVRVFTSVPTIWRGQLHIIQNSGAYVTTVLVGSAAGLIVLPFF